MFDVIIVGGSVAGLSAALVLGRCCRRVLVCDAGKPRNRASHSMHSFLSRDGIAPKEFLRIARDQVAAYPSVSFRDGTVTSARASEAGFDVTMDDGTAFSSIILLLATGIVDELPSIPGIEAFYGKSVHHCLYCDGWEYHQRPLAVYGRDNIAAELALEALGWSRDILLCTEGPAEIDARNRARLRHFDIRIVEERIQHLEGDDGLLHGLRLANGELIARSALFFSPGQFLPSDLPHQLGCRLMQDEQMDCNERMETSVPGVFAAGNSATGLQLAIVAAAEGAKAAYVINEALRENWINRSMQNVLDTKADRRSGQPRA